MAGDAGYPAVCGGKELRGDKNFHLWLQLNHRTASAGS
jgi:hypothetical protein